LKLAAPDDARPLVSPGEGQRQNALVKSGRIRGAAVHIAEALQAASYIVRQPTRDASDAEQREPSMSVYFGRLVPIRFDVDIKLD
jgi:hypothetical protein